MRVTQVYLDQLEREAKRLDQQAAGMRARNPDEAARLAREASARRERIARLRVAEVEGVRTA